METSSIADIKKELNHLQPKELIDICLRLSKFKKANKELAHYILFESQDEDKYIQKANEEISQRFAEMPSIFEKHCALLNSTLNTANWFRPKLNCIYISVLS
jgi:hypothetical protein